jgi:hypothetical protein
MAEVGGPERGSTARVFISYASPDVAVAERIVQALEHQALKCWIAPRDATPGAHYASEIVQAIDSTRAIALIFSEDAASAPHVLRELERATSQWTDAETAIKRDLALSPEDEASIGLAAYILTKTSKPQEALEMANRIEKSPELRSSVLPFIYEALGRKENPAAALDETIKRFGDRVPYSIAGVYAHRRDVDQPFTWLTGHMELTIGQFGRFVATPCSSHFVPILATHTYSDSWD